MRLQKNTSLDSIPFPVEVPYAMRPHMQPWSPEQPLLSTDGDFDRYIQEKKKLCGFIYGNNVTAGLLTSAVQALKRYVPDLTVDAHSNNPVHDLTMSLQEDFVIWAPNDAGDLSAQVLSVCFPSGWAPEEKVNMTFQEIHEPIPDFDTVRKASGMIARMITEKGPFVRHVWSVSNTGNLNRHPRVCPEWENQTLDEMWFRSERQVTVPMDGQAALFLIRVYVVPLKTVFEDAEKKQRIIAAVNSMSDAVLDYKSAHYLKSYLNQHVA
jgi:hypothetical protein